MQSIDITPEDLEIVQSILSQFVPHEAVWVFGSRITGLARKFSDLDLAIITDKPLDFDRYAAIKEAFSDSHLPFKVDIVDWSDISDHFKNIIKNNYVILQKRT